MQRKARVRLPLLGFQLMSTYRTSIPKERQPGPYGRDRHCACCHARLSSYNGGDYCAPCSGGDWVSPEDFDKLPAVTQARLEHRAAA